MGEQLYNGNTRLERTSIFRPLKVKVDLRFLILTGAEHRYISQEIMVKGNMPSTRKRKKDRRKIHNARKRGGGG
jgi:hypothetical protein